MKEARSEAIEKAAADWLARREGGRWTAVDQSEFDRWLEISTLHRVAYLRIEHAWEEAARLKAIAAAASPQSDVLPRELAPLLFPDLEHRRIQGRPASMRRRRFWWAAAALVPIAISAFLMKSRTSLDGRFTTPIGGVAAVSLADGSRVTLNTDSEVRVAMSGNQRNVQLRRGEVYFEVAKDPHRTFVVDVGIARVTAVGTKFAVRRDAGTIQIVVTEGKVGIEMSDHGRNRMQLVGAGSVARTTEAGTIVQPKTAAEAEEYTAWLQGFLVLQDVTLAEAAEEFNRYNSRKIIVDADAIRSFRIAGTFRPTNVDGFARLLAKGYPLRVEDDGDRIVLKADRAQE